MAYKIYTTDAIVCGNSNRNTSDKEVWLFTREAGMVRAHIKSVREEKSKLRYALQDFSKVSVTMLHGRHTWKVIGVEPGENFYFSSYDRSARMAILEITRLLRRLLPGEVIHAALFDIVLDCLEYMERTNDISAEVLQIATLRILHALGYIAPHQSYEYMLEALSMKRITIDETASPLHTRISKTIEYALAASQL